VADTTSHPHASIEACAQCGKALEQALGFYQGHFMVGFSIADSPEFEDWQLLESESLGRELIQVLKDLVQIAGHRENGENAEGYVRRWLAENPLDEDAHRSAMELYAARGNRSAAIAQFERCQEVLRSDLGVDPVPETVALLEAIRAGNIASVAQQSSPLPFSAARASGKLPVRPATFIGRGPERAEIGRLLAEEQTCRLLILVGPGGIGKTELAIQVASENRDLYPDGVYFVALQSVEQADNIVHAIARALDIPLADHDDPSRELLKFLEDRRCLILLDNFEQLVDSTGMDILEHLLAGAPGITVLITSRLRLNLQSEWSVDIHGLAMPDPEVATPEQVAQTDAVRLFVSRARRMDFTFSLTAETRKDVVRICRLLDGSPLGIVLAAAWLRMLSCHEIAEELAVGLDFLATPLHDLPRRQRNLRTVFDHSWRLLVPEEQLVFARLTVFQGGFTRRAAERVADATLPILASLVDNSLIQLAGDGRYRIHALLQQFAAEKLERDKEDHDEIRRRHAGFYATYVFQRVDYLKGSQYLQAIRDMGADYENIQAAWQWAVAHRLIDTVDRFVEGLLLFYECRGWFSQGYQAFDLAMSTIAGSEQPGSQLQKQDRREALVLAELSLAHGILTARHGDIELGRQRLEYALTLLQNLQPAGRRWEALALHWLGHVRLFRGRHRHAMEVMSQAVEIYRDLDDHWGIGVTLTVMAAILYHLAEYAEQERVVNEAVQLLRSLGEQRWLAFAINHRAYASRVQGRYSATLQDVAECLRRFEVLHDQLGCGYSLREMAYTSIALGEYDVARTQMEAAYKWFDEAGARYALMFPLEGLARIAILTDDYAEAESLEQRALTLSEEVGELRGIAQCLHTSGWLAYARGDYGRAQALQEQSLKHFQELDYRWGIGAAHNSLAATLLAAPTLDIHGAARHVREAFPIAHGIGALPLVMETLSITAAVAAVADGRDTDLAIDLADYVLKHPATEAETRRVAGRLHAQLATPDALGVIVDENLPACEKEIEQLWKRFSAPA
jgi:predicted ATPase